MFEPPNTMETAKRAAKEVNRHQVLIHQPAQPAFTPTSLVALQKRDKAKKSAVTKVMQTAKPPPITVITEQVETGLVDTTNTIQLPASSKRRRVAPPPLQMVPATEPTVQKAHLCGCRHGDLEALKSFTRADAAYYIRPNRFLEAVDCLDCAKSVVQMLMGAQGQKAVVFYCDEGIKGFDAPSDDPMKEELTCDLVLCPPGEAIRRISFEKENAGRGGRGRSSRSRT